MYKWDIDYLLKIKKISLNKFNTTKDPNEQKKLWDTLQSIDYALSYYQAFNSSSFNNKGEKESLIEIVKSDQDIFMNYGPYVSIINRFIKKFGTLDVSHNFDLLPTIDTSIDKMISLNNDFYEQFKGEITNAYQKISSNFERTINFKRIDEKEESFGQTLIILGYPNLSYFDIGYCHTVQDYITLIHETGHSITNFFNHGIIWDFNKYCFNEVDTLFWEQVGLDYIDNNLAYKESTYQIRIDSIKDYIYCANLILVKDELYHNLRRKDLYSKNAIIKYIKHKYGNKKALIKDVLNIKASSYFNYIISYLTAVEVYLIYLNNKDLALDILMKIIKAKDMSAGDYLKYVNSLGIIPGKNYHLYVDNVIKIGEELNHNNRLIYRKNK